MKARCKESKSEHREEWVDEKYCKDNWKWTPIKWVNWKNVQVVIEEILVMGYCKSNLPI